MKIQMKCAECSKKIEGGYRMKLMHGPNGYRQYAICLPCADGLPAPKRGGRQMRAKKQKQASLTQEGAEV